MNKFISQTSKIYAQALIELDIDKDTVISNLNQILEVFENSDDLTAVLSNSSINFVTKKEILNEIFEGKINDRIINFLFILVGKNRINLLDEILEAYSVILANKSGICVVEVTSAVELDGDYKNKIVQKLETKLSKKIEPTWNVLPEIIGGLIYKIGDTVIDSSLKYKIENFTKIMK